MEGDILIALFCYLSQPTKYSYQGEGRSTLSVSQKKVRPKRLHRQMSSHTYFTTQTRNHVKSINNFFDRTPCFKSCPFFLVSRPFQSNESSNGSIPAFPFNTRKVSMGSYGLASESLALAYAVLLSASPLLAL